MLVEGKVGPVLASDQTMNELRQGRSAELITSDAHARYQEAVSRGNVCFASNQAGIATPAGLTTASKNFTLYNPYGSGKYLALLDIQIQATVDPVADAALWLVGNLTATQAAPSSVTSETVRNALLGGAAGVGLVYNTCTLPATPVVIRILPGVPWASAVGFAQVYARDEVAGMIIIPPGIFVSVQGSAAITAAVSMYWEEIASL